MKVSPAAVQHTLELEHDLALAMAARRHSARIGPHQARELIERITGVLFETGRERRFTAGSHDLMNGPFIH